MIDFSKYGFSYTGACNCDGITTHKYKRDRFQLKHRVKQGTFKLKKDGQSITQWISEENAIKELEKICGLSVSAN